MKIDRNYKQFYDVWVNNGRIVCPDCGCYDVLKITISEEGQFLICKKCQKKQKIGEDFQKTKKGFYRTDRFELGQ